MTTTPDYCEARGIVGAYYRATNAVRFSGWEARALAAILALLSALTLLTALAPPAAADHLSDEPAPPSCQWDLRWLVTSPPIARPDAPRVEEDEVPWRSPSGARLIDYNGRRSGSAVYADGRTFDGRGWQSGRRDLRVVDPGTVERHRVVSTVLTVLDYEDGGILPIAVERSGRGPAFSTGPDTVRLNGGTYEPDLGHVRMHGAVRYEQIVTVTIGSGRDVRTCEST